MDVLIKEVQKRNLLWNRKHPRYKDRVVVNREWDSVAANTIYSKADAKKKWRNLRDQFLKEIKKLPAFNTAAYTGQWQFFNNLVFLKETIIHKYTEQKAALLNAIEDTQGSKNESENNSAEYASEEGDSMDAFNEAVETKYNLIEKTESVFLPQSPEVPVASFKIKPMGAQKKRKHEDVEQRLGDIEAKIALLETPEDENFMFLRSLLPYFKKMDPLQQLRVRTKFQQIIMQEMLRS